MEFEVFVQPGVGSSDALMDWLERHEIQAHVRNVVSDASALAEALALGAGALPVTVHGGAVVSGFDPAALESLAEASPAAPAVGVEVEMDLGGEVLVGRVLPGGLGQRMGLQPGDVVAKVGGYGVFTSEQFLAALDSARRRQLTVTVRRGKASVTLSVEPETAS
ncbi:MAG: PDZ domain-containing protein [Candidatus Dormibacteraceae bacterium]